MGLNKYILLEKLRNDYKNTKNFNIRRSIVHNIVRILFEDDNQYNGMVKYIKLQQKINGIVNNTRIVSPQYGLILSGKTALVDIIKYF